MKRVIEMKNLLLATAAIAGLSMTVAGVAGATGVVSAGFDLFQTGTGTAFDFDTVPNPQTVQFEGNPLGTFDFGDGNGAVNIDPIDMIIERLQDADPWGDTDTIDIEIVALSLRSTTPVDLGFGAGFEFLDITLNTSSPSSQSEMTIFDIGEGSPHGTFDSILNFSFDVIGSIGGFYATIEKTLTSDNNDWQHAPTGGPVIDGINHLLNGLDETTDLWLEGYEIFENVGVSIAVATPEPSTAVLVAVGLAGLAARGRRRR